MLSPPYGRTTGKHHAAVRALAYKWTRITYRFWKTNTRYSETRYLQQLQSKASPILKFLDVT